MYKRMICSVLILAIMMTMLTWNLNVKAVELKIQAQTISAGYSCTAAIKTDGTLWTWGNNRAGGLGDGTKVDRNSPAKVMENVAAVSSGNYHMMAVKTDGSLWAWGANSYGQLGDGTKTDRPVPVKIMDKVVSVKADEFSTMALKSDGTVWSWGNNSYGQLGNDTSEKSLVPVKVLDNVASISMGFQCSAAVKTDGSLWIWGYNEHGELGDGMNYFNYKPQKVMDKVKTICADIFVAAIKTDSSLWTWGYNKFGELGDGTTEDRYKPAKVMEKVVMAESGEHSAVIKADGSLWTWGWNHYGQLGNGTKLDSTKPEKIMEGVAVINTCAVYSLAVKKDGSLWAWGNNEAGQLGDGTNTSSLIPVKIMDNVATGNSTTSTSNKNVIKVLVNNKEISLDTPAVKKDGKVLIPLTKVLESIGAAVSWNAGTQTLTGTRNNKTVSVKTGSNKAKINSSTYFFDLVPSGTDRKLLAPVSFIAESFNVYVHWNAATNTVEITDSSDAFTISRVKAYTTDINMGTIDSFNHQKVKLTSAVIKELNNSLYVNGMNNYKALINNDTYVSSTFKKYLFENPSTRVTLGLGALTFNDEVGDYLVSKWPEKEKYKEMLKNYVKNTQSYFEVVGYAQETVSFAEEFIKAVSEIAPAGKYGNISKLLSKLKAGNLSIKELDATSTELLSQIKSAAGIEKKLDKLTMGGKLPAALGQAGKVLKIANTAIDSIEDIIFAANTVGMYQNYENIFKTIENDKNTVPKALKVAAAELKAEMNANYESLVAGITKDVAKLVLDDALDASKILSSGALSSITAGLSIGTFLGNVSFGIKDMVNGATYTEGYAYLCELFSKELEQDKKKFLSSYSTSFENALLYANTFKRNYETLQSLRLAGENSYLKMTSYDTAFFALKKSLRTWTNFEAKDTFCKESIKRLNSCSFK